MELKIGNTFYKTNEYLYTGDNSSGIIAQSNIKYLSGLYKNTKIEELSMFNEKDSIFTLKKEFEKQIKRPTIILFENLKETVLFIRDDIFFKINKDIEKDPVLDYKEYVKLENELNFNNSIDKPSITKNKVEFKNI